MSMFRRAEVDVNVNLSAEVTYSLRVLGLAPGATAADVRSAFRRLARTCHPDVTGRQGSYRFQEITGAYTLLKGLPAEELKRCPFGASVRQPARRPWPDPLAWYRRRAERAQAEAEAVREAERREEERRSRMRDERVGRVLDRYERALSAHWAQVEAAADRGFLGELLVRLASPVAAVRYLALGRLGTLANREEVLRAVGELLRRHEIDDRTARLVAGLPLRPECRRRLAEESACRAGDMPDLLLSALLGLRMGIEPDPGLMDRYLGRAKAGGAALLLRYWPGGVSPSDKVLLRLLDQDDERVLVPLLCAMKQRFPMAAHRFRERLEALWEHPSPAVRVWSRVLTRRNEG